MRLALASLGDAFEFKSLRSGGVAALNRRLMAGIPSGCVGDEFGRAGYGLAIGAAGTVLIFSTVTFGFAR
jgi:hypothetical protein